MKIIGHRGACGLAPENTLAAITAGIAAGADRIEIDVRVTLDDVPVLWHNPTLLNGFEIRSHTLKELRAQKSDIPTLEQAIVAIKRRVPLTLEIKRGANIPPIVAVIKKFLAKGWQAEEFFIASFDFKILQTIRVDLPNLPLVVLEPWSGVRATWRARQLHTPYLCMNYRFLWSGFIKSMSRTGYKLAAYTLNNPRKIHRWEKHGLYGVVTDFPDRFRIKKYARHS